MRPQSISSSPAIPVVLPLFLACIDSSTNSLTTGKTTSLGTLTCPRLNGPQLPNSPMRTENTRIPLRQIQGGRTVLTLPRCPNPSTTSSFVLLDGPRYLARLCDITEVHRALSMEFVTEFRQQRMFRESPGLCHTRTRQNGSVNRVRGNAKKYLARVRGSPSWGSATGWFLDCVCIIASIG